MPESDQLSVAIIRHGAPGLARFAASELLDSRPELREPAAFATWQGVLRECLDELSAALAAYRPQFFADHVAWTRTLLVSRGVSAGAFRAALACLQKVLAAELPPAAAVPAAAACEAARRHLERETPPATSLLRPDTDCGRRAASYLLALLEGDRLRASRLILDAAQGGYSLPDLYLEVLMPAQEELGRMWHANEINIAEEHFASATTKAVLAQLRLQAPLKAPNGKTVLTAAVEGNHHDIGIQTVADFFEMDGWRVVQLASDVPIPDLVQAIEFYRIDLLALSVSRSSQLPTLQRTIAAVRHSPRGATIRILIGGRGLNGAADLAPSFGADAYASDPLAAVAEGRKLVGLA